MKGTMANFTLFVLGPCLNYIAGMKWISLFVESWYIKQ